VERSGRLPVREPQLMALPPLGQLGPALRQLRRLRGLRQRQLAELTGFARSRVSQYERGRTDPTVSSLWCHLDALGASLSDLERIMREREADLEEAERERESVGRLVDWLLDH